MVHPIRLASVLAFLAFPILEIGLLIRAGQWMGFWKLALIVIVTAMLGSGVIRRTGFAVLTKARQQLDSGGNGFNPLLDGLVQITAGMLLIFPGLISDAIGLLLLIPALRGVVIAHVLPKFFAMSPFPGPEDPFQRPTHAEDRQQQPGQFDTGMDGGVTIEGEYERVSEAPIAESRDLTAKHKRRSSN